jgi:hypothetical protein
MVVYVCTLLAPPPLVNIHLSFCCIIIILITIIAITLIGWGGLGLRFVDSIASDAAGQTELQEMITFL